MTTIPGIGADVHWPAPGVGKVVLWKDQVHVWCARLEEFLMLLPEFHVMLSLDERARAARFKFTRDRDNFVLQAGLLRCLLSQYLPVWPSGHEFVRGRHGKPELVRPPGDEQLYFNVSHSGPLALYAITRAAAIGVDIERVRPMEDLDSIARNFFATGEAAQLGALPGEQRLEPFFNCWTRKEAVLKATGRGISGGVDCVEVSLAPGEPARVVNMPGEAETRVGWSLHSLTPATGYIAALAYEGTRLDLDCRALSREYLASWADRWAIRAEEGAGKALLVSPLRSNVGNLYRPTHLVPVQEIKCGGSI